MKPIVWKHRINAVIESRLDQLHVVLREILFDITFSEEVQVTGDIFPEKISRGETAKVWNIEDKIPPRQQYLRCLPKIGGRIMNVLQNSPCSDGVVGRI